MGDLIRADPQGGRLTKGTAVRLSASVTLPLMGDIYGAGRQDGKV
jgi:hypothetical protein